MRLAEKWFRITLRRGWPLTSDSLLKLWMLWKHGSGTVGQFTALIANGINKSLDLIPRPPQCDSASNSHVGRPCTGGPTASRVIYCIHLLRRAAAAALTVIRAAEPPDVFPGMAQGKHHESRAQLNQRRFLDLPTPPASFSSRLRPT